MPELPEVETVARHISQSDVMDCPIENCAVFWGKTVSCDKLVFEEKIIGRKILSVSRRGKYLIFGLDAPYFLVVHLRMSGQFFIRKSNRERLKHEHVIFSFQNGGSLHYHDPRKFGRMYLTHDLPEFFSDLGIEPLSDAFSFDEFCLRTNLDRAIKPLLLDQKLIAGLGNIYVDEALWQASVHPLLKASCISFEKKSLLWKAIPEVLKRGILFGGTSLGKATGNFHSVNGRVGEHQNHLQVFQRKDRPCLRCSEKIIKMVVFQRGTYICPNCQKL